jgi:hypothetical protein
LVTATILLPLIIMTAFGFGGSPVPSIKVGPNNTDIVSLLFIVSSDNDDNTADDESFGEMEEETMLL